jgi:hypothetical protein
VWVSAFNHHEAKAENGCLEKLLGEVGDGEGNNDSQHPLHLIEFTI